MDMCIPAPLFAAAQHFISNEATRYYLGGVFVEQLAEGSGTAIVATDGHTLGCGYAPTGFTRKDAILAMNDKPFLAACRKGFDAWLCVPDGELDKPAPEMFVVWSTGGEPITDDELAAARRMKPDPKARFHGQMLARGQAELIDATFPEWRRVVPSYGQKREAVTVTPWFNSQYVNRMTSVASILTDESVGKMRICASDADQNGPALVSFSMSASAFCEFFAIIMPMRDREDPPSRPDWVSIPSAQEAVTMAKREMANHEAEKAA